MLRVFRLATERHVDPKTKVKETTIHPDRLLLAFEVYGITEKEKTFHYLAKAVNIINGEE